METEEKKKTAMRVVDMTEGSPLKLILAFCVPIFIGNIFQQFYTMADTMVVGHSLGDSAIAAIGATSALYSLIFRIAFGMNNGYGIVVTRSFGSHDERKLRQSIAGMVALNLAVTLFLTALALIFLRPLLVFINTPEGIFEQAYLYIVIVCGGMVFTICYNMFASILRALGNSRAPLYFLITASVINIVLDIVLVMWCHAGVGGAAAATIAAQAISAALGGRYLWKNYREVLPRREDFRVPGALLRDLLSTGIAMALMESLVDLGTMIFQRACNRLGETAIAAFAASRRILETLMEPLCTLAIANSTFAGQNMGARKIQRIRATLKKVLCLEAAWALLSCLVVWDFGGALVRLITGTESADMLGKAVLCLRIQFSFYPALSVLLCMRDTMQAIGFKAAPVASSGIELVMKIFAAAYLIPSLGFLGVCVTEPVTWVFMAAYLAAVYMGRRKKLSALDQEGSREV
ncbi:MAG: MATE family efflux transporter [Clostridium sp.]|nr:MATE family efflux transporter [Clostridium sp.]